MNAIDIFIVLGVIWAAVKGYRQGAVRAIAGLASYLVAVWAAISYVKPFNFWLESTFRWTGTLTDWLVRSLPFPDVSTVLPQPGAGVAPGGATGAGTTDQMLLEFLSRVFGQVLPAMEGATGQVLGNGITPGVSMSLPADAALFVAAKISGLLVQGAVFLLIFFLVLWGVRLLAGLFSRSLGRGVISSLNRWTGLGLEVVLATAIWSLVIGVVMPWLGLGSSLQETGTLAWLSGQLATSRTVPVLLTLFGAFSARVYALF